MAAPKKIKLKLTKGNTFSCNLMNDLSNSETYLKWILVFLCVKEEKKLAEILHATMDTLSKIQVEVTKYFKVPKKESMELQYPAVTMYLDR